jgi:hypothetical protein
MVEYGWCLAAMGDNTKNIYPKMTEEEIAISQKRSKEV